MGYVNDTAMAKWVDPNECQYSAGTWADAVASNVWTKNRTAADATFVIKIPIKLLQNGEPYKGSLLTSVDIWWEVTTAAMDAMAAAIYKVGLPADTVAFGTPAAQTFTYDAGHDSAAERLTMEQHKMTMTLSTPIWVDDDDQVYVELSGDAAASSVFKFHGARANFTLRA